MKPSRRTLIAKLFALARELGISKETLSEYCAEWTNVTPQVGADGKLHLISILDAPHLSLCIHNLVEAQNGINSSVMRYKPDGLPLIMAEPKQKAKIAKLGYLLHWDSRTIRNFIARETRGQKRDWNEITLEEASAVIVGMEHILRPKKGKKTEELVPVSRRWNLYE